MKIIILGAGQVGTSVAESLVSEANDITVVDYDGERLANLTPHPVPATEECIRHDSAEGLQLIRQGRDLIFYITRARTPMPKSTREYIERCVIYFKTGRVPLTSAPLPA